MNWNHRFPDNKSLENFTLGRPYFAGLLPARLAFLLVLESFFLAFVHIKFPGAKMALIGFLRSAADGDRDKQTNDT
jgi:hypothetical protein